MRGIRMRGSCAKMCYVVRKDKKRGDAEAPPRFCSRAVQHAQDERNALANGNKANHHRHNHRQQADHFSQYTLEHIGRHDGAELSCSGSYSFLRKNPFLNKMMCDENELWPMVAGSGIEPLFSEAESDVLPLHHPAIPHRPAHIQPYGRPMHRKEKERYAKLKEHAEEFINEKAQQNDSEEYQKAIYIAKHLKCFLDARYKKLKLLSCDGIFKFRNSCYRINIHH